MSTTELQQVRQEQLEAAATSARLEVQLELAQAQARAVNAEVEVGRLRARVTELEQALHRRTQASYARRHGIERLRR